MQQRFLQLFVPSAVAAAVMGLLVAVASSNFLDAAFAGGVVGLLVIVLVLGLQLVVSLGRRAISATEQGALALAVVDARTVGWRFRVYAVAVTAVAFVSDGPAGVGETFHRRVLTRANCSDAAGAVRALESLSKAATSWHLLCVVSVLMLCVLTLAPTRILKESAAFTGRIVVGFVAAIVVTYVGAYYHHAVDRHTVNQVVSACERLDTTPLRHAEDFTAGTDLVPLALNSIFFLTVFRRSRADKVEPKHQPGD